MKRNYCAVLLLAVFFLCGNSSGIWADELTGVIDPGPAHLQRVDRESSSGLENSHILNSKKYFLNGSFIDPSALMGIRGGALINAAPDPVGIDKGRSFVSEVKLHKKLSEFSLAKMDVTVTPEPMNALLFIFGLGAFIFEITQKKKDSGKLKFGNLRGS